MSDYKNSPCIIVKTNETVHYTMSPSTWNHFAYFRNIVHDVGDNNEIIELVFMEDFDDFWLFLKDKFPREKVDYALKVKEYCNILGLFDNGNIFCGRLEMLLVEAANQFMNQVSNSMVKYRPFHMFTEHLLIRDEMKIDFIKKFLDKSGKDPRCYILVQELSKDFVYEPEKIVVF